MVACSGSRMRGERAVGRALRADTGGVDGVADKADAADVEA